tara:strand:+ start:60 stop:302 length:243 start_codon:yes stop_codon:yes gene_type:complete
MIMVQTLVTLTEEEDRVVNVVKGLHGFRNKSQAIEYIIHEYENELFEPELRPEFIDKMKARQKEKTVKVKDFRKHFGLSK